MKIKFTLDQQDVFQAIAKWVTEQSGIPCRSDQVHKGAYSFEPAYVEIDTDEEQEMASIEAQQELDRITAIKEAA